MLIASVYCMLDTVAITKEKLVQRSRLSTAKSMPSGWSLRS